MKDHKNIAIGLLFLLGLSIFLYPTISQKLSSDKQVKVIESYRETVSDKSEEWIAAEYDKAKVYNKALLGIDITDPFVPNSGQVIPDNYNEILDFGDGMISELIIPSINVHLPIYHGTEDHILRKGVGHLPETAFPISGKGNHSVVTGHTGLPNSKLLTDLSKVDINDKFQIKMNDRTYVYNVYEIQAVLPHETNFLRPEEGRDLLTIITCTPYGVNTHRLLVKAEFEEEIVDAILGGSNQMIETQDVSWAWMISFVLIILILILGFARNTNRDKIEESYHAEFN